jgi:hypothetical protein
MDLLSRFIMSICFILGLLVSGGALFAGEKKLIKITFDSKKTTSSKQPIRPKKANTEPRIVAADPLAVEVEVEPLTEKQRDDIAKELAEKRRKRKLAEQKATEKEQKSEVGRKVASVTDEKISTPPPVLKQLLKKFEKDFASDLSNEVDN